MLSAPACLTFLNILSVLIKRGKSETETEILNCLLIISELYMKNKEELFAELIGNFGKYPVNFSRCRRNICFGGGACQGSH